MCCCSRCALGSLEGASRCCAVIAAKHKSSKHSALSRLIFMVSVLEISLQLYPQIPQITQRGTGLTKTEESKQKSTPKVFDNSSPGLSFGNPGTKNFWCPIKP